MYLSILVCLRGDQLWQGGQLAAPQMVLGGTDCGAMDGPKGTVCGTMDGWGDRLWLLYMHGPGWTTNGEEPSIRSMTVHTILRNRWLARYVRDHVMNRKAPFLGSSSVLQVYSNAETTSASYLSFTCQESCKMFSNARYIVFALYLIIVQVTPKMADGNGC